MMIQLKEEDGGFVLESESGEILMTLSRGSRAIEGGPNSLEEWRDCAFGLASKVIRLDETVTKTLLDAAFNLIERDPHFYSARPCQTCQAISEIIKRPFGCIRKAMLATTTTTEAKP